MESINQKLVKKALQDLREGKSPSFNKLQALIGRCVLEDITFPGQAAQKYTLQHMLRNFDLASIYTVRSRVKNRLKVTSDDELFEDILVDELAKVQYDTLTELIKYKAHVLAQELFRQEGAKEVEKLERMLEYGRTEELRKKAKKNPDSVAEMIDKQKALYGIK